MKRRIFAVLLAVSMVFTMSGMSAAAGTAADGVTEEIDDGANIESGTPAGPEDGASDTGTGTEDAAADINTASDADVSSDTQTVTEEVTAGSEFAAADPAADIASGGVSSSDKTQGSLEEDTVSDKAVSSDSDDTDGEITETASGTCGDDLAWVLTSDGTLTISGTGEMEDYGYCGAYWYSYADEILTAVVEDGVTDIGSYAFCGCSSLTNVEIPDSVTTISDKAFYDCSSLTDITIPDSVTGIGVYAFYKCTSLASIDIPNGVTSIGSSAFYPCTSLTDVYYKGTSDEWDAISIGSSNSYLTSATIHYNSSGSSGAGSYESSSSSFRFGSVDFGTYADYDNPSTVTIGGDVCSGRDLYRNGRYGKRLCRGYLEPQQ